MIMRDNGSHRDEWRALADHEALPEAGDILIPFARLREENCAHQGRIGVEIPNTHDAEALKPYFERIALIAVDFPSFADGRGFSIARRLRALGFTGTLRASGRLIADQYAFVRACGFDEVQVAPDIAARQPEDQWLRAASAMSAAYQRGGKRLATG